MNRQRLEKATCALIMVMIASIFAWLFLITFMFTDNYELIAILDDNEFAFQVNLWRMANDWNQGRILDFFSNTFCAYGSLFWTVMTVVVWPIRAMEWDQWAIALPRQISLLGYGACLFYFYRIARLRGYSQYLSFVGLALIVICNHGYDLATFFHNHTLLAALTLASFYYLLLNKGRSVMIANILFAVAVGIKISTLYAVPIYLYLWMRTGRPWKNLFSDAVLMFVIALLVFSPAVLFAPFGNPLFMKSIENMYVMASRYVHDNGLNYSDKARTFFQGSYHWVVYIIGALMNLWILFKNKNGDRTTSIMTLLSLLIVLAVFLFVGDHASLFDHTMAYTMLFTLIFLEFSKQYPNVTGSLGIVLALHFLLNLHIFTEVLDQRFGGYYSEETWALKSRLEKLELAVPLRETDTINLGLDLPRSGFVKFPLGLMKSMPRVQMSYMGDIDQFQFEHTNIYIFKNNQPTYWDEFCKEVEKQADHPRKYHCGELSKALVAQGPYKIIYEDPEVKVVRREDATPPPKN